ncbi:hypothetical protein ACQUFY_05795 [Robbsia andropogonis]|uniref:hypothetical protein n=1 Tax=Robbsia andropogonis TaxID=28092 RepID=UPI003D1E6F15
MKVHNTYSEVMFNPEAMRRVVRELAGRLPELRDEYGFDTIVVTGKSGRNVSMTLRHLGS